jgi:hypothetical protein
VKEQKLVSEKIKKSLSRPLGVLLRQIFESQHIDFDSRLQTLSQKIEELNKFKPSPPEDSSLEKDSKLKMLEEKLNRIEDLLNTRAAEIFDLKEQVQMIDFPKEDTGNLQGFSELTVLKEDLKKQKKILDDKKFANDGTRLELLKIKKEKSSKVPRNKKELEVEVQGFRDKNKTLEKMIERFQVIQNGNSDRTRMTVTSFEGLQESLRSLKDEQRIINVLKPRDLVNISKNVFASYRTLKDMQEKMVSRVNGTLEKIKGVPGMLPKIVEIQEEIEKNYAKNI